MLTTERSDLEAWLRLVLTPGVGPQTAYKLLKLFSSPSVMWQTPWSQIAAVTSERVAAALQQGPDIKTVEHALAWAAEPNHHILCWGDPDYPSQLLTISASPPVIYFQGNLAYLQTHSLAMVGSRNATPQGKSTARAFSHTLSDAGLTIVSGLALGIDTAAHEGGLQGASGSLAVLGTGLECIYPHQNRDLADRLLERGGLLSELPLKTPPVAQNFPRRNRLISGLAKGCLVVEASLSSGSLITARLALEQGREVFAIPGSIHSPFSKGCHRLIKDGAKLVESAEDVLEEFHFVVASSDSRSIRPAQKALVESAAPTGDDPLHGQVLNAMSYDPVDIDTICGNAQLNSEVVSVKLLELELQGVVIALSGGRYQRMSGPSTAS